MDRILHNFIADMPGPYFLGFYALVIVTTLILCGIVKHVAENSPFLPIPLVPEQPDPYELAYLRNGEQEVARVVVFNLIRQKFLEIVPDPAHSSKQQVRQTHAGIASSSQLHSMERCVFDWFARPRMGSEVTSSMLLALLNTFCTDYQRHLEKEGLLTSSGMMSIITPWLILLLGMLIIVGLGGYKLCVAVKKGHYNVFFLILMGIIAVLILIPVCKAPPLPRLSARGRKYLAQLQTAFGSLKYQIRNETGAGNDMTYLLTIGLFGTAMLAQTPYVDYYRILHPVMTSNGSSSSGSGDGGGNDGGGGGCGGGGCGGGGCGGGGCGGCGG